MWGESVYVYDVSQQLIAEYTTTGSSGAGTSYMTSDTLGTPRVVTGSNIADSTGGVKARHDYLPFGEEVGAGVGGRTTNQGYSQSDNVRQKFTGKERDAETGLDYFLNRYYSSTQGRFTGVDMAGPDLTNPQTLNKYQYCLNNPLRYIDRNGLYEEDVHRGLTEALALAAGYDRILAGRIAAANQFTDDNPATSPFSGVEARRGYHFTTAERRAELWERFNDQLSTSDLGIYLHAEQDSFSHEGFGPKLGQAYPPWTGSTPDKTYNDPAKADRMGLATYNTLVRSVTVLYRNEKIGFQFKPLSWKVLSPLVQQFNRAKTPEEKQKALNQIRTLALDNLRRQAEAEFKRREEAEKKKKRRSE